MKNPFVSEPFVTILSDGLKESFWTGVFVELSSEIFGPVAARYIGDGCTWDGPVELQAGYFNGCLASNDGVYWL
jgi:hypothetical protein